MSNGGSISLQSSEYETYSEWCINPPACVSLVKGCSQRANSLACLPIGYFGMGGAEGKGAPKASAIGGHEESSLET